ncbi:glutathione S-transferase family protein [Maricaulis sp. CAU 1757]
MSRFTLYGQVGFGSTCVEAALELLGLDYDRVDADPFGDDASSEALSALNPLGQVPTLVLPDDDVMTESAAILIWLGDRDGTYRFAPPPDSDERAEYLRWMLFLGTNIYPTYTISDAPGRFHPDRSTHDILKTRARQRRKMLWEVMEEHFDGLPGPYLLGPNMSLLDVYVAMMSFWSPRREWFFDNCPSLASAVRATESHGVVARVWKRNFELEVDA